MLTGSSDAAGRSVSVEICRCNLLNPRSRPKDSTLHRDAGLISPTSRWQNLALSVQVQRLLREFYFFMCLLSLLKPRVFQAVHGISPYKLPALCVNFFLHRWQCKSWTVTAKTLAADAALLVSSPF